MSNTKIAVIVVVIGTLFIALFMSGCSGGNTPSAPDMTPVGDGLSFIGLGLVLAAIISLVGILIGRPK